MRVNAKYILVWIILLIGNEAKLVSAQSLRITEIAYEEWFFSDDDGDFGNGWIELRNTSSDTIIAATYFLKLNNDPQVYSLPEFKIPSGEHLFVWLSGKNRTSDINNLHAPWLIDQNVNKFLLVNSNDSNDSDSVTVFSRPYWNETHALLDFNGSFAWFNTDTGTPGKENISMGLWKRASTFSQFQGRDSSPNGALYFDNKFWILEGWLGGGGESASISDVWCSTDGRNWIKRNEQAPYYPYSAFVVFQNKMWAFDGNAYSSIDGITWTKVAENLPFTHHAKASVLKDEIFVLDGNAIHKSADGIIWETIQQNALWENRLFAAFLSFKNRLWMFGGSTCYFNDQDKYFNDVWSSADGINWEVETDSAAWIGRLWPGSMVFDNKLWIMGGWRYFDISNQYYGNRNDVWYSEDGRNWKELNSANSWLPRHAPLVWATEKDLWISSGFLNNYGLHNDVWTIGTFKTTAPTEFYLKDSETPLVLNSWSTDENGNNGLSPRGFEYDFQNFNITKPSLLVSNGDSLYFRGEKTTLTIGDGRDTTVVNVEPNSYIAASVNLNNFATLILKDENTPYILSAQPQSELIVEALNGDSVVVKAKEVGNVLFKRGEIQLTESTRIKSSATFSDAALFGNFSLQYAPDATLVLKSTAGSLHMSDLEIPQNNTPGKLVIDSQVFLEQVKATIDSIQFINGRIVLTKSKLGAKSVENFNALNYIVTNDTSTFELSLGNGASIIPMGTKFSYNPIVISSTPGVYKVRLTPVDTLTRFRSSVNLIWSIVPKELSVGECDIQFSWGDLNKNKNFSPDYIGVYQYADTGWRPEGLKLLSSTVNSIHFQTDLTGSFSVGDNRKNQILSSNQLAVQYGEIFTTFPIAISSSLPINVASSDSSIVRVENDSILTLRAGIDKLVIEQAGDSTYAPLLDTVRVVISKKELLVDVLNPMRKVGEADPVFKLNIEGFAYDETIDYLDVLPKVTTNSDIFSPAGNYELMIAGNHPNYDYALKQNNFIIIGNDLLQLFPNPTNNYVNVVLNEKLLGDVIVSIIDLKGWTIVKEVIRMEYSNSLELLISDSVEPGVYCLKIESENFTRTGRLIIQ